MTTPEEVLHINSKFFYCLLPPSLWVPDIHPPHNDGLGTSSPTLPLALQSSGSQSPSHYSTSHSLHPLAEIAGVYWEILGPFLSVGSPPPCSLPWLLPEYTVLHFLLPAIQKIWKDQSSSLKALWWASQRKTEEKDWWKILPCGKHRGFRCWRRTGTRGNWGYHSWEKVQLWEELTCDTNTMKTIYFSSPDQSNLSRQLLWLHCNCCQCLVLYLERIEEILNKWAKDRRGKDNIASSVPCLASAVLSWMFLGVFFSWMNKD